MVDIEKVIEGLSRCTEKAVPNCFHCPYECHCQEGDMWVIKDDALELLKKQQQIVRCEDCKHGRIYENCVKCENAGNPGMFATYHRFNWFCADGERKDNA